MVRGEGGYSARLLASSLRGLEVWKWRETYAGPIEYRYIWLALVLAIERYRKCYWLAMLSCSHAARTSPKEPYLSESRSLCPYINLEGRCSKGWTDERIDLVHAKFQSPSPFFNPLYVLTKVPCTGHAGSTSSFDYTKTGVSLLELPFP